jgi:hypothetical protein
MIFSLQFLLCLSQLPLQMLARHQSDRQFAKRDANAGIHNGGGPSSVGREHMNLSISFYFRRGRRTWPNFIDLLPKNGALLVLCQTLRDSPRKCIHALTVAVFCVKAPILLRICSRLVQISMSRRPNRRRLEVWKSQSVTSFTKAQHGLRQPVHASPRLSI